jgi:gliding motility-associated-like protein
MYMVDVLDANGCSFAYTLEINQPEPLNIAVAADSVLCSGQASGRAIVTVSGGTAGYEYAFSAGADTGALPNEAINLAAGSYEAIVTDANSCQETVAFEVGEPAALQATLLTEDARCAGQLDGAAQATASGGSGPYSFRWENDMGEAISAADVAAGLAAGTYAVIIEDRNACQIELSALINEPDSLLATATVQDASCQGVADGAINLETTGGTPGYSFEWNDIGSGQSLRDGLAAGVYAVVVRDGNGCEFSLELAVESPQALELTLAASPASCFGAADGQAIATVAGGTGDYAYQWSDGQDTPVAIGLAAGTIGLLVEDSNGCEAASSILVEEPPALELSLDGRDPACFGGNDGTISALPQGGVGGYLFAWSNGQSGMSANGFAAGTHSVTLTDANGCNISSSIELGEPAVLTGTITTQRATCLPAPDGAAALDAQGGTPPYSYQWSTGAQSAAATGLAAGVYHVTLTDANGCQLEQSATVEGTPAVVLALSTSDVSCQGGNDGRASVIATGGEAPYSYQWGSGLPNTPTVESLSSGNYNLTVADNLGCTATASFFINQPPALIVDTEMDMVSCSGGTDGRLRLQPRGGTPPYTAQWSTGTTGNVLDNLAIGSYTATVTDALGCSAIATGIVTEARPVDVVLETTSVNCHGESTGAARVLVSGGVAPYRYEWSNGAQTPELEAVLAGDYTLSITDAAGCQIVEEVFIAQPAAPLTAEVVVTPASCHGADDGRIELLVSGGTPGYRYRLDDRPSGSSAFIRLSPGAYRPMVEDANGCELSLAVVTVREPVPIEVDLGGTQSVEYGASLIMTPFIQGGQGALTYAWTPRDSNLLSCFDCLNPEVWPPYQVGLRLVVTDERGCQGEGFVNVYARKDRPILVPTGFTPNGDGNNDILLPHAREGVELLILAFRVYDRWGERLFEAIDMLPNEPAHGWDGTFRGQPVQPGVYIWEAVVEYPDRERQSFKGNTTLIR